MDMNGFLIAGLMMVAGQVETLGQTQQVYTNQGWVVGQQILDGPYAGQYRIVSQSQNQGFVSGVFNAVVDSGLQAIAHARAAAMAAQNVLSHGIGGTYGIPAGVAEGIGYGPGPAPATCVLPGQCVADATAVSANGLTYRVRFFK
jgi:hypothetical protein